MSFKTLRGHYNIIRPLAQGGFGQTFLAEDLDLPSHPLCVVKQLHPYPCEDWQLDIAKRLFEKEAQTLYKLGVHDRIPRLFAHFQEGNEFYLVQEFIEGESLDAHINDQNRHSPDQVRQILEDILEILVFIHDHQVIHRDIKPSNLIRRKHDQRIVLIDFGAVKELTSLALDAQGNTYTSITIGTPGYMPNEQLGGKPRFSSDIYALGMVCIQALTATAPDDLPEDPYTHEIAWHDLLDPSQRHPGLLQVLDKMVRLDFRQRYQFASDVIHALSHADNHVNLQATIVPAVSKPTINRTITVPKIQKSTHLPEPNPKPSKFWLSLALLSSMIVLPVAFLFATLSLNRNSETNQAAPTTNSQTIAPEQKNNPVSLPPTVSVTATPRPAVTVTAEPTVTIPAEPQPPVSVKATLKPQTIETNRPSPEPAVQNPLEKARLIEDKVRLLMDDGQTDQALAFLDQSIQEDPNNWRYWYRKIHILYKLDRRDQLSIACGQAQARFGLSGLREMSSLCTIESPPTTASEQIPILPSSPPIDRANRTPPPLRNGRPPRPLR